MNLAEVLSEMAALGTEQNRKIYKRHGASDNQFGLSWANLGKLHKRIRTDHALALALWDTGNCDARLLATFVADPAQADDALLERWAAELSYQGLSDAFAKHLVFRTTRSREKMKAWTKSGSEWIGRAGWVLVSLHALSKDGMTDADAAKWLKTIEKQIHSAKNYTKEAMNNALIAIGMRNDELEALALAAAGRIGTVVVDHGETGCKTPDAAAYILKAKARKRSRPRTC